MRAVEAITRRNLLGSRARDLSFAGLFLLISFATTAGYRHTYSTAHSRLAFVHSFGDDKSVRVFYGTPHDLASVGGYAGWRVAGLGAVIAAIWAMVAAIRATRGEEEAGRAELVLAGNVSRGGMFAAGVGAIAIAALAFWLAIWCGLVAATLPAGGSAYLALAAVAPVPLFAAAGILISQALPSRRLALQVSAALLLACFVLRVLADTVASLDWLCWVTPLGWAEELRPFAGTRPVLLAPLLGVGALLLAAAAAVAVRRDLGSSLLSARDSAPPKLGLLSSPTAQALRSERGTLAAWVGGVAFFALIIGLSATEFTSKNISEPAARQFHKLGGASITTPSGALSFYFIFFVLAISVFMCSQVAAARRDEADQQLETLFALPVARSRWLWGRIGLASAGAVALALAAGLCAWIGEASQGAGVPLGDMVAAGANCLPAALLFLGLATAALAFAPRASIGLAYGLVTLAFVWQLFGALVGAPDWTLALSPFHDVGLVPARPFALVGAVVMLAGALLSLGAGVRAFARRDLVAH